MPQKNFFFGGIYYFHIPSVYNTKERTNNRLPMDKTSTPITEHVIRKALKKEKFPRPSVSSLEFIKNFARNFRVEKEINGDYREFVLN